MIVVSLLLILVSGGLLAVGILQANDPFVMASIGVSVLAAAALFLGIRQQRPVERPPSQDVPTRIERKPAAAGRVAPAGAAAGMAAPPARASASVGAAPVAQPPEASPPVTQTTAGRAAALAASGKAAVRVPPPAAAERVPPPAADQAEVTETQVIDRDAVTRAEPGEQEAPVAQAPATAPPIARRPVTDTPAAEPAQEPAAETPADDAPADEAPVAEAPAAQTPVSEPPVVEAPAATTPAATTPAEEPVELDDDEDPPDEPVAELLMASEVSRLAALENEVLVVDGRPRYHLSGCPHLADKESQPLPVSEAVELGFNACSLCGAATAILAEAEPR